MENPTQLNTKQLITNKLIINLSRHIKNIFEDGELFKDATVANFATVQIEGDRQVGRNADGFFLHETLINFLRNLLQK